MIDVEIHLQRFEINGLRKAPRITQIRKIKLQKGFVCWNQSRVQQLYNAMHWKS